MTLRQHLIQAATEPLYQWEAERLQIAEEPEMIAAREQLARQARIELAYRERRRAHLEALDDSILRGYHEENLPRFRTPQLLRMRLLVRRFEGEGQEWFELFEQLDQLADRIRTGELDFATEAARWSQDVSARRGGDTGWVNPRVIGDWTGPRAAQAVLDLALEEVSQPIMIERYNNNRLLYEREGFMLVRVEEIRGAEDPPFEEIRDRVAEQFVASGTEELREEIRREVLTEIGAEIFQAPLG